MPAPNCRERRRNSPTTLEQLRELDASRNESSRMYRTSFRTPLTLILARSRSLDACEPRASRCARPSSAQRRSSTPSLTIARFSKLEAGASAERRPARSDRARHGRRRVLARSVQPIDLTFRRRPSGHARSYGDPQTDRDRSDEPRWNALKFTPDGGISKCGSERMRRTAWKCRRRSGNRGAELSRIDVYQWRGRHEGATGGGGIGLALARDWTALHGYVDGRQQAPVRVHFRLWLPRGAGSFPFRGDRTPPHSARRRQRRAASDPPAPRHPATQ